MTDVRNAGIPVYIQIASAILTDYGMGEFKDVLHNSSERRFFDPVVQVRKEEGGG